MTQLNKMNPPEGWPTKEMITAGINAQGTADHLLDKSAERSDMAGQFMAMMAAAPTPPVCQTCNGNSEIGGFVNTDSGYENEPCPECATPTPPAQEDEPVAWLIPRIMKMPGNPEIDGTVAWEACVFCDTRVHPRVDKNGSEFYPKPLYTRPADDQETLIKLVSHVHQDAGKRIERLGLKRATLEAMATVGTMRRQINMAAADYKLRKAAEEVILWLDGDYMLSASHVLAKNLRSALEGK